jgi:hypothetical protein
MRTLLLAIILLIPAVLPSYAQSPVPAPSDLTLKFDTENNQHEFRLGELIPVHSRVLQYEFGQVFSGQFVRKAQRGRTTSNIVHATSRTRA